MERSASAIRNEFYEKNMLVLIKNALVIMSYQKCPAHRIPVHVNQRNRITFAEKDLQGI